MKNISNANRKNKPNPMSVGLVVAMSAITATAGSSIAANAAQTPPDEYNSNAESNIPVTYATTGTYKINMKIVDGAGKVLQANKVVDTVNAGESWDITDEMPKTITGGYKYRELAEKSDPISGKIGTDNKRDQNIVLVYRTDKHTVQYIDGVTKKVVKTVEVEDGKQAPQDVEMPDHTGYKKTVWDTNKLLYVDQDIKATMQYDPITYVIKYDPNGATDGDAMPVQPVKYDVTATLTKNTYKRNGYIFTGWKSGDTHYDDGAEVRNLSSTDNATVVMTAQWEPAAYTITFDKNRDDATGTTASMDMGHDETKELTPNGFVSPTAHFSSWNTRPDGSGVTYANKQQVKNLISGSSNSITLYAQWSKSDYTVLFVDGLTGDTIVARTVNNGETAVAPTKPIHKGYTALAWSGNYQNVTKDETVTVNYRPNTYTISFKGNGGEGSMPDEAMTYDTAKTLSKCAFTKTGYSFAGWQEQNTKAEYANNAEVKNLTAIDNGSVTLVAQWKANEYNVKYDANGGNGTMPNQTLTYDKEEQLTSGAFKRPGYAFTGWRRDNATTGKIYKNRENVLNLLTESGATTTMYAQWRANTYTVTFIDGYTGKTIGTETVDYGGTVTTPIYPTHDGYAVVGWDKSLSNITDDTTITLNYRPNKYTVKFDGNGATGGSTANAAMEYEKTGKLTKNGFTRSGYTFAGWSTSADGKGTQYSDEQSVTNLSTKDGETITLYAIWKANTYTVTFVDGKTNSTIGTAKVEYGGNATLPSIPTHKGYKSNGWDATGKNITGDTKITATYAPISYRVSFDKNGSGATGSMSSQSMTYDAWANLTTNAFSRPGYHFVGWNTKSNGTGTSYTDGEKILNLADTDGDSITLYAQWVENDHIAITYKASSNDGKGSNSVSNSLDDINPNTGTPAGSKAMASKEYDFTGWYDANGTLVSRDEKFVPTQPSDGKWVDAAYTARFTRKQFTVKFVDKDGKELKTETVKYGAAATAPDAPKVDGYDFSGWDKDFNNVTGNLEVKATYKETPKPTPTPSNPSTPSDNPSTGTSETPQSTASATTSASNATATASDLVQTGIEALPVVGPLLAAIAGIAYAIRRKH